MKILYLLHSLLRGIQQWIATISPISLRSSRLPIA
jgi:hypothetical protein